MGEHDVWRPYGVNECIRFALQPRVTVALDLCLTLSLCRFTKYVAGDHFGTPFL